MGIGGTGASRRCSYPATDRVRARCPPGAGAVAVRGQATVAGGSMTCSGRRCDGSGTPRSASAISNSCRMIARARSTPAWPPAASAQNTGFPSRTPRAPSATAIARSRPRRTPPSTHTSAPAVDRGDDLGEDVDRGRAPVELPRTVVADDDAVHPPFDRQPRVLGREDPLEDEREVRPRPDRGDVVPGRGREREAAVVALDDVAQPGSMRRRVRREVAERWEHEPGPHVALAVAEDRQIHGQDDRPEPGCGGPFHEGPRDREVALEVELEPAGDVWSNAGDLLHRPRGHGRQDERDAGRPGRAGRGELPIRMGDGLDRHRGDRKREGGGRSHERRRRVDVRDVDEDAGPKPTTPPGRLVLRDRDLVPGATGHVVEGGGVHRGSGERFEVGDPDDLGEGRLGRAHPTRSRLARLTSIVFRPTEASLNATVTSSSLRVSLLVTTMPSPQRA